MVAADFLPEGEVKSERKNIYIYGFIYIYMYVYMMSMDVFFGGMIGRILG